MKKNIICSDFSDERSMIIDYLAKTHDWEPTFIMGSKKMSEWAKEAHKNAIFYDSVKLRNGQFDYAQLGVPVPIDAKMINALSENQFFCLDLVEDTTGWNFSFHERRGYYYNLLKFWNTVIHRTKPEIFISWVVPHNITEYILYQLCKYYKIETLFINMVPAFNYGDNQFFHVNNSLEDQSEIFERQYLSDETYTISDEVKEYFKAVRSKGGLTPPYTAEFYENAHKYWNPGFKAQWFKVSWRLLKLLLTGRILEKTTLSFKSNKHPFESKKSKLNYPQYVLFNERVHRDDKKLGKVYSSYTIKPDFSRKYIYYAAALHPEAGIWNVYQDQFLMLDLLAASIPEGWVIYYKEHPAAFVPGCKSSLFRKPDYYERVSKYKNVQMVSTEVSTFKLIDSAQAVATGSGTVGWESIVRGTPTLIFSPAWYQACEGVFMIETYEDCLDAIEKAKDGYKPDQSKIERFAAVVEQMSAKNIIHGNFVADQIKACDDPQREMERIGELFYEAHQRYYQGRAIPEFQTVTE